MPREAGRDHHLGRLVPAMRSKGQVSFRPMVSQRVQLHRHVNRGCDIPERYLHRVPGTVSGSSVDSHQVQPYYIRATSRVICRAT